MIARSHFTRIADEHEVDAKTVERDYVLAHVLAAIGAHSADQGLVFKGGTALRLCYFEDYRYSADLDFSLLQGANPQTALEMVTQALASLREQLAPPHLALASDRKTIEYEGPLGKRRQIKLDIATDELVENTTVRALLPRYPDQFQTVERAVRRALRSQLAAERT